MEQFKSKHTLEYTFDRESMDMIKNHTSDQRKALCSEILHDRFHITIHPDIEGLSIYFGLLRWPRGAENMNIDFKIMAKNGAISNIEQIDISYHERTPIIGEVDICSLESLKTLNTLSIKIDIDVKLITTGKYFVESMYIDDPVQISYLLSENA